MTSYFAGSWAGGAPLAVIAESIHNQREAAPLSRPEGRGSGAEAS